MKKHIGLIDSGKGGLSVLAPLKKAFPEIEFHYIADTAHFPYGNKTADELFDYCKAAIESLEHQPIDSWGLACHTASVLIGEKLRHTLSIPLFTMIEPTINALKTHLPANNLTILATEGTLESQVYQRAIAKLAPSIKLNTLSLPQVVDYVQKTEVLDEDILEHLFLPLLIKPPELLLLASTHYGHLTPYLSNKLPSTVIDPAFNVAELFIASQTQTL